jgi:hypothetical protein
LATNRLTMLDCAPARCLDHDVSTATQRAPVLEADQLPSPWRDDLIAALLGATLVLGLFLDGWNHINLQNGALGSFFTPWHGMLYAGVGATAVWVLTRNPHLYVPKREPQPYLHHLVGVPLRYPFALAGLALATVGMVGDAFWHAALGEEEGVARVIGPFHLFLFAGAGGLLAASFRSAWHAPRYYPDLSSFRTMLPPLLSLTLITALAAFMFQWLSPFVDWTPSIQIDRVPSDLQARKDVEGTIEDAGVARILVTNLILLAPILLALRRWRLPFWSVTCVYTTVASLMSALTEFELGATIFAAAAGGLVADALIQRLRPSLDRAWTYRVVALVTPLTLWGGYFLALGLGHDVVWPFDLWLGTVGLAGLMGALLSYLTVPPATPMMPPTDG